MKIHIIRRPETVNAELYLYEISDDGRQITTFSAREDGSVLAKTSQREAGGIIDSKPLLTLPEADMRSLIKAFLDLAREEGYKNGEETFAKGKLEATQDHLKDLRQLLKLK